ncbi:uncharacterized protein Dmoj_GI11852 [Drosophila mojavensis]|uniref:DDE Tnp4 domain-containing protein n=1 Tax=Drosophila mojavensis TaxID=7230 RepID=B4KYV4_DROMO|nr:uncharacterized protein Dmoj_GI11852 [Drosophila mojavensis]
MEEGLKIINSDLSEILSKLLKSNAKCKNDDLQHRRRKIATLIRLHVRHLQQIVIMHRRRRQQRAGRRLKNLRSFFMQQMMQLQSNYIQMFVTLRMKYNQLQSAEEMEADIENSMSDNLETKTDAPTLFWEHKVPKYSDEQFLDSFHVTRSTFQSLCGQLAPTLRSVPELKSQSEVIPPDKCVGLALFFLASGERISIISEQFSLPRARTIKCLKVFCNAVMTSLGKALRLLPQSEADCANVVAGFRRECNMPPALLGVLGVCSIPLRGKGKQIEAGSALRMEFLLDDRMLFRELRLDNANGSGKQPLPPMFAVAPNALTQSPARRINQRSVPAFVLAPANQNYPLRPWLLQRYAEPAAPHEYDFNEVADHLQELSDSAMHRLMSRWRFLSQPLDISFQTASCIITAATVLHNLLEELSEPHIPEWGNSVNVLRFKAPPIESKIDNSPQAELARDLRDFLARTISSTEM